MADPVPTPNLGHHLSIDGFKEPASRKKSRALVWTGLIAVAVVAGLAFSIWIWFFHSKAGAGDITAAVVRGNLLITVNEKGELESTNNTDIRCEVEGREIKIVSIIPEGTHVKKGEVLVVFDSEQLQRDKADQEVKVKQAEGKAKADEGDLKVAQNKAEDDIEKAKLALRLAILDRDKYLDKQGEYTADIKDKRGALALAKKELEETETKLVQFRKSVRDGLFPREQLRAKEADYEQKKFNVERDEAKLVVLEKFTRERQEAELTAKAADAQRALDRAVSGGEASVAKAKSELEAAQITLRLENAKLERIEKQIARCTIKAPDDGILVYNKQRWWDDNSRIQAGAVVFHNQTVCSLPDLSQMQLKVKVHESMVKKVQKGEKVEIRLDAFPSKVLHGKVTNVATMASAEGFFDRFLKQYETIVAIDDLPKDAGLKPGFGGHAKIFINEYHNVLLVPVQSVAQKEGQHIAYVAVSSGFEARPVTVGENNDKFVEIKEGLNEGERVALDARARLGVELKDEEIKDKPPATPSETGQPAPR